MKVNRSNPIKNNREAIVTPSAIGKLIIGANRATKIPSLTPNPAGVKKLIVAKKLATIKLPIIARKLDELTSITVIMKHKKETLIPTVNKK